VIARTPFRRTTAVVLAALLSQIAAPLVQAGTPHLVDPQQVGGRLQEGTKSREDAVRMLQEALAAPEVQRQAKAMGMSAGRLRAAVPHLSDSELADLGQRAGRATDLAAGHRDNNDGLVILGVVLLLAGLAVLVAVSEYDDYYYDDCYCY
jgi:hypothetical protein